MSAQSSPLGGLTARLGGMSFPGAPGKWTKRYLADIIARQNRRIKVLQERIRGQMSV
jgi:hypothetical protein